MNLEEYKPEVLRKASEILKGLANDLTEDSEGAVLVYKILIEAKKDIEKKLPDLYAPIHPEILRIIFGGSNIATVNPDKRVWKAVADRCQWGGDDLDGLISGESLKAFREQVETIVAQWNKPKSIKTLMAQLPALGFPNAKASPDRCEAYGKKVEAYVQFASNEERKKAEGILQKLGWIVNKDYYPGSGTAEIQVSYFKAHHWDV